MKTELIAAVLARRPYYVYELEIEIIEDRGKRGLNVEERVCTTLAREVEEAIQTVESLKLAPRDQHLSVVSCRRVSPVDIIPPDFMADVARLKSDEQFGREKAASETALIDAEFVDEERGADGAK